MMGGNGGTNMSTLKCPQCGAGLPHARGHLVCQYCGSSLVHDGPAVQGQRPGPGRDRWCRRACGCSPSRIG